MDSINTIRPPKEYLSTIHKMGQATIPAPVRNFLGSKNIKFVIIGEEVKVEPVNVSLSSLKGIAGKHPQGKTDLNEISEEAHKKFAKNYVDHLNNQ